MKNTGSDESRNERRRAFRRPILATFAVFISIPKKGDYRLQLHDISEFGMGFDLDIEGEKFEDFTLNVGNPIELRFYLNQSLFIPLTLSVVRIQEVHLKRRVGAEFQEKQTATYQAFLAFIKMIDHFHEVIQIEPGSLAGE